MGGVLDNKGNAARDLGYRDGTAAIGIDNDLLIAQLSGCTILGWNYSPTEIVTSLTLTNQTIFGTAIYLPVAATLTGVYWYQATQGSYTANNNNRVGLFTSDGTNLTNVASSSDDGTLWKAASASWGNKAFSSTYPAAAGVYWVLGLYCRSAAATAPVIGSHNSVANVGLLKCNNTNPAIHFTIGSQTNLPSTTTAWSGVSTATSGNAFFGVY